LQQEKRTKNSEAMIYTYWHTSWREGAKVRNVCQEAHQGGSTGEGKADESRSAEELLFLLLIETAWLRLVL